MNFYRFHARSQAEWEAQRKRLAAAVEQCDHIATPEEVAAARAVLERDPAQPQGDLLESAE